MTTYYISGPMRGKKDFNRQEFAEVESALWADYLGSVPSLSEHKVINPSRNFGGRVDLTVAEYMELDLKQVLESDVIVLIPGWQQSEGSAKREVPVALWSGKRFVLAEQMDVTQVGDSERKYTWVFREVDAPEFSDSPRASVLDEAKQLITGDRNNAYGPPTQDFQRTAAMASAFGFEVNGKPLASHHVAIFMVLLKMSRLAWTPTKRDSWTDTAGYAGCGYECAVTDEAERLEKAAEDKYQPIPVRDVDDEEFNRVYSECFGDCS